MSTPKKLRLAVLASGNGSNFEAIVRAIQSGDLLAEVVCLFCNVPHAKVLERAQAARVPTVVLDHRPFADREEYTDAMLKALLPFKADLVVLAGYMRILPGSFLRVFSNRVINIHPSLLPEFPGLHAIEKAWKAGAPQTGVTVHIVDEGVDTGPILAQESIELHKGETLESLENRVHQIEHRLLPRVLNDIAWGRMTLPARPSC